MARRYRFTAVLVAMGVVLFSRPAGACSCAPIARDKMLPTVSDVFIGTVVGKLDTAPAPKAQNMPFSPLETVSFELEVSETLKGQAKGRVGVATGADSATCGFPFVVGHRYLVFARSGLGTLRTSLCFQNAEGPAIEREAAEVRKILAAQPTPVPKRR